jgi:hypothetical protein
LLLLKGSRGVRMETVLEAIEAKHRRTGSGSGAETLEAGRRGNA